MRLFVAVDLPAAIKDELARTIETARPSAPNAKWVPRDNLHLTLSFLGEVADDRVPSIEGAVRLSVSSIAPIATRLGEGGAFPSPKRARVLWVGLDEERDALASVAAATARGLEPLGFTPEARPWAAHLTIARLRTPADVRELLPLDVRPVAFEVGAVTVFRSRLARPAPRYEPVATVPLEG